MLADVRQRLGADEVRRRLDGRGVSNIRDCQSDRYGAPIGELTQRGEKAAIDKDWRVNASSKLVKLRARPLELRLRFDERCSYTACGASRGLLEQGLHRRQAPLRTLAKLTL